MTTVYTLEGGEKLNKKQFLKYFEKKVRKTIRINKLVDKKEKIYEFKPLVERFFNFFYEGKKIIITNAYRKKGQKVNQRELDKAKDMKKDYESRSKGGHYYG